MISTCHWLQLHALPQNALAGWLVTASPEDPQARQSQRSRTGLSFGARSFACKSRNVSMAPSRAPSLPHSEAVSAHTSAVTRLLSVIVVLALPCYHTQEQWGPSHTPVACLLSIILMCSCSFACKSCDLTMAPLYAPLLPLRGPSQNHDATPLEFS